jgi:hypothetical protein
MSARYEIAGVVRRLRAAGAFEVVVAALANEVISTEDHQ